MSIENIKILWMILTLNENSVFLKITKIFNKYKGLVIVEITGIPVIHTLAEILKPNYGNI
ncbi:hypothetical protein C8N46_10393 [Kordia periserrulae]|uniref:Uncharacterized protein n=1 Tax=Kordia periserrulae TaxID=701523 RepID=A0A2T6C112_9FLAO|nr:hypothetical protein C8N46_10393 [Kordia periserrulae]